MAALAYNRLTEPQRARLREVLAEMPIGQELFEELRQQGREQGHEQGREEGRQEAREEGREAGRQEGREQGCQDALRAAVLDAFSARFGHPGSGGETMRKGVVATAGAQRAGQPIGRPRWQVPDRLEDGVIALRPAGGRDVDAILRFGSESDVAATAWLPVALPAVRTDAERVAAEFGAGWAGRYGLTFAITVPPEADMVGVLHLSAQAPGVVEVGYGVAPECRHRGFATRAVRLIADWCAAQPGVERVEIVVTAPGAHGLASRRVAEKAGFVDAGTRRSRVEATGSEYEDPVYVWLPPDRPDNKDVGP